MTATFPNASKSLQTLAADRESPAEYLEKLCLFSGRKNADALRSSSGVNGRIDIPDDAHLEV
jgi:hypothetical protein